MNNTYWSSLENGSRNDVEIAVDGLEVGLVVIPALQAMAPGKTLADRLYTKLQAWSAPHSTSNRLTLIRADNGYKAGFVEYVTKTYDWLVDISQKPESAQGFVPQMGRWQVERSYGWLNSRRRLSKDDEKTLESSEAMLILAFISFLIPKVITGNFQTSS